MVAKNCISLCLLVLVIIMTYANVIYGAGDLKSEKLCSQCSTCDTTKCPVTEDYPHMTAFDDTLIAGALQSDFVDLNDRGVYSVFRMLKVASQRRSMLILAGNLLRVQLLAIIGTCDINPLHVLFVFLNIYISYPLGIISKKDKSIIG